MAEKTRAPCATGGNFLGNMIYTDDQKLDAKRRFFHGEKIPEIAAATGIERRTLYNWAKGEDWTTARPDDPEILIRQRIALLLKREDKSEIELRELLGLAGHLEVMERMRLKAAPPAEGPAREASGGDARPRHERRQEKRRGPKNDFRELDEAFLMEKFREGLFGYQLDLWEHRSERIRNILKSRQIGLTWYFAREAFVDALLTGRNKIFLSASRAQADVFRGYIKNFAREWFEVELYGKDTIEIHTAHGVATLYFLSTNSSTAQSYHGDVYLDEYFWIPKFELLNKVASAMASHKQWTKTYFSTPSAKSHEGYPFWSGDLYNQRMQAANKPLAEFPTRDRLRMQGEHCVDGQWRRIISLDDAEREGCDLFDRAQLELEYSPEEFRNLFLCYFIDDTESVFKFSDLEKCLVDPEAAWGKDYREYKGPVWIGYDPSRSRDGASIIVLAPPVKPGDKFRVLEKVNLRNIAWQAQADQIRKLTEKYRVTYIGIDTTGNGSGVFEMVKTFYPAAKAIIYSVEQKTKLVLKAQAVIGSGQIEWPAFYSSIGAGFLQIHRCVTGSSQITYSADRTDKTGHADDAWATMHALIKDPLISRAFRRKGSAVIG